MTLQHCVAAAASALLFAGCSLLCSTSGVVQACDSNGDCLDGFFCNTANQCEKASLVDSGPALCTTDADCPGGACVSGLCDGQLVAWLDGNGTPDLSCLAAFPPGPTDAGGTYEGLGGCILTLPGDSFSSIPAVFQGVDGGQALVSSTLGCGSDAGYQYTFAVLSDGGAAFPVDQLFTLATFTDAGRAPVQTFPVFIPSGQAGIEGLLRNVFSISPDRIATLLSQMDVTIDGGEPTGGGTLLLGIVNDCSGAQVSGVQVVVDNLDQPVSYLDATGTPDVGRQVTSSSALFASFLPPGGPSRATVSYLQPDGGGGWIGLGPDAADVVIDVELGSGGVVWVPLSPSGP